MKIWIGDEQEGKYKGIKTLFIATDDVMLSEIDVLLDKYQL